MGETRPLEQGATLSPLSSSSSSSSSVVTSSWSSLSLPYFDAFAEEVHQHHQQSHVNVVHATSEQQDQDELEDLLRLQEGLRELEVEVVEEERGSTVLGATFNFTNSVIGAGAIGLGGAMAKSGGGISVLSILGFGYLTKVSLDLVIRLSLLQQNQQQNSQQQNSQQQHCSSSVSYEDLGRIAFGWPGWLLITVSRFVYAFGCLVAYMIVIKDNMGPAIRQLLASQPQDQPYGWSSCAATAAAATIIDQGSSQQSTADFFWNLIHFSASSSSSSSWKENVCHLLQNDVKTTWIISSVIVLPLCLLRDMTPLAFTSILSVTAMIAIVAIVMDLYVTNPSGSIRHASHSFQEDWLQVLPVGYLESLGTFVFTYVSQHMCHLTFHSLKRTLQTEQSWKTVTTRSIGMATAVSLVLSVTVYMSFWQHTVSDIFQIYPHMAVIEWAKLLLAMTMTFTFPLPFFACRELLIVLLIPNPSSKKSSSTSSSSTTTSVRTAMQDCDEEQPCSGLSLENNNLRQPLLPTTAHDPSSCVNSNNNNHDAPPPLPHDNSSNDDNNDEVGVVVQESFWLLSERDGAGNSNHHRQLKLPFHFALTVKVWIIVTALAIAAPNLGDVLGLVGCVSGTLLAFLIPGTLAWKLEGWSVTATILLLVGSIVGVVGTFFSFNRLLVDMNTRG